MNPGPWGMAQTGVPFGEVKNTKEFLGKCLSGSMTLHVGNRIGLEIIEVITTAATFQV